MKKILVCVLIYEYKILKMKYGETIEEIFARFGKITSELKAA